MSAGTLDVAAWQYDADRHCTDCYTQHFDLRVVETDGLVTVVKLPLALDSEGNAPHPLTHSEVYACMIDALEDAYGSGLNGEELLAWASLNCGTCDAEINKLDFEFVADTVRRWREDAAAH